MVKIPKIVVSVELDSDENSYYSRELILGFIPSKGMILSLMIGGESERIIITEVRYEEQELRIVLEGKTEYKEMNDDVLREMRLRFESDKKWKLEVL
ncbi:MAG: hypothetical protein WC757_03070 [Candidatus Paceibacterota bacterium]|jgi:hypothetical protein